MTGRRRSLAVSAAAGLVASTAMWRSLGVPAALLLGAVAGLAWPLLFRRSTISISDAVMSGAALGVPLWLLVAMALLPGMSGASHRWTAEAMRALLPALLGVVTFGAALGGLAHLACAVLRRAVGPDRAGPPVVEPTPRRVVILGGGFAGFACARELERLLGADRAVQVTLVSETNALLFTPMLAEVAGSSLEPTHISTPLRTSLRRTAVTRAEVSGVELDAREVHLVAGRDGAAPVLPYDHLVLALGAVTNFFGNSAIAACAVGFKSLREAMHIRDRVIDAFERAEREPDPARRRAQLTFVVAGGGFAGVELAGALNDFARGMVADFPRLDLSEVHVLLVHPAARILPELSSSLAAYAEAQLRARGVEFRLGARVKDADAASVTLDPPEVIPAETLVWTAGARPHPLLERLAVSRDRRGAVLVDSTLAVPGRAGVWAAGDCAAVTDARTGKPCPPTAQFALREGTRLARNILATLRGKPARPFQLDSLGALCVIGHQTACAELTVPFARRRTLRFSGFLAWMLWRAIYVAKLPGLDRKVRVVADWVIELFFPRDIVQTAGVGAPAPPITGTR